MSPARVLYVDLAPTPAGSIASLKYLVRDLDRTRFTPILLLAQGNPAADHFREQGIEVHTIPSQQGRGVSFGGKVDAIRQGRVGAWVRSHPRVATVWHTVGALGRWRRKLWPEAQRIRHVIQAVKPDLLHLNAELVVNRPAVMAAYLSRVPTVCHVRGWETWDIWDRWLSRAIDAYICISQAVAQRLQAQKAIDVPIHVIYNGLDVADVPTTPRPGLYQTLGLSPDRPTIGIFGRLVPWKGHHIFVQALAEIARAMPHVQGIVVGGLEITAPTYLDELQGLAQGLGIADRLFFLGHRDDVLDLYALVDVLVHASVRDEPFGRVIIEGMAAARPVVATRGGGTPEIVREGVTGFLVPQGDPRAMAQAVLRLLQDPELARRMGEAARADVVRRFDARETARQVMAVYDQVLRKG